MIVCKLNPLEHAHAQSVFLHPQRADNIPRFIPQTARRLINLAGSDDKLQRIRRRVHLRHQKNAETILSVDFIQQFLTFWHN
jgi:hypothetical protein